jgi:hypothetical protein
MKSLGVVLVDGSSLNCGQPAIAHVKAAGAICRFFGGEKNRQTFNVNGLSQST